MATRPSSKEISVGRGLQAMASTGGEGNARNGELCVCHAAPASEEGSKRARTRAHVRALLTNVTKRSTPLDQCSMVLAVQDGLH